MKTLVTERLVLRRFDPNDFEPILQMIYRDEEVYKYYTGMEEDREVIRRRFVRRCHQSDSAQFGFWAVEQRPNRLLIGQMHLDPYVNKFNPIPGEEDEPLNRMEVELAFAFGRDYWGQGYATEACRAAIAYVFDDLKLARIVGGTPSANERATRLHEKLGYDVFPNPRDPEWNVVLLRNPL